MFSAGTSKPSFSCSGTLINDRYVITGFFSFPFELLPLTYNSFFLTQTAAHCVHPKLVQTNRLVGVRLGEWNLATNPDCDDSFVNEKVCSDPHFDVGVEEMIIHEKYLPNSFNQHNDITLLRLTQKIIFTEFIKPICIQTSTSENLVGQSVTVAGFGKTELAFSSNIKLKVSLEVVENDKCDRIFRTEGRRLFDGQLCAGGRKGLDSCRGDSGGEIKMV